NLIDCHPKLNMSFGIFLPPFLARQTLSQMAFPTRQTASGRLVLIFSSSTATESSISCLESSPWLAVGRETILVHPSENSEGRFSSSSGSHNRCVNPPQCINLQNRLDLCA